jgi:hypothetical protein
MSRQKFIVRNKEKGEFKKYFCGFCKYKFETFSIKIPSNKNSNKGYSTSIICPNCTNYVKND